MKAFCLLVVMLVPPVMAPVQSGAADAPPAPIFSVGAVPTGGGGTTTHGHFAFSLAAGQTGSAAIAVLNDRDTPLAVDIYSAELIQNRDGTLSPSESGSVVDGPHLWLHTTAPAVTVNGHATVDVPFSITVPAGTPPGDHPAAVVVSADIGTQGNSVVQAREALIVEIRVPGTPHPAATLGTLTTSPAGAQTGPMTLTLSVTNSGDVTVDVSGTVVLTDSTGQKIGTVALDPSSATLIPGGTFTLQSNVWTPPSGVLTKAHAEVQLALSGQAVSTLSSNTLTRGTEPPPTSSIWPLLGAIGLLLLALGGGGYLWRRRRNV